MKSELLFLCCAAVLAFALIEAWRFHVFGVWMPNTVYAKRFPPYRDWSTPAKFLGTRLRALAEPMHVFAIPVLLAAYLLLTGTGADRHRTVRARLAGLHPGILLLATGCFAFGLIFGRNLGYPGRMIAALIPFLILGVLSICASCLERRACKVALIAMVAVQVILAVYTIAQPFKIVSASQVESLGIGADEIREALGEERLRVMFSDVGASALCCEKLSIIDSGMLADPTLATHGWAAFHDYFERQNPEVVEMHTPWSTEAGLYRGGLLDGYSVVASNGIRYFVRNDLFAKLLASRRGSVMPIATAGPCLPPSASDKAFAMTKGVCLVLNHPATQNNID